MGLSSTVLLLLALAAKPAPEAAPPAAVRVLAVGANQSYRPTAKALRFAEDDARRFAEAMRTVGLVPAVLSRSLTGATVDEFRAALADLAKGGPQVGKFIFYFSGHSDETGLQFKDGLIEKEELHRLLTSVEAQTKVAILDSCFSGAMTAKGVETAPAFDLPRVEFDEPSGSVFLTASTARQLAFESDQLAGSVFTHHLLNGLYGQADGNGDGVVTVDELYQYVYRSTKWATLSQPASASQEPEYVARLSGQGAVMLSYPAQTNAPLKLEQSLGGEVTIASPRGIQFFKVEKEAGVEKTIQLPVGEYRVSVRDGTGRVGSGEVEVQPARLALVGAASLHWERGGTASDLGAKGVSTPAVRVAAREPAADLEEALRLSIGAHSGYLNRTVAIGSRAAESGVGPLLEAAYVFPLASLWRFDFGVAPALSFHRSEVDAVRGLPSIRTDTTSLYADLESRFFVPWRLLPFRVNTALGMGQAYADQRIDFGEKSVHQGGTVPGVRASAGIGLQSRSGRVYSLTSTIEALRTADVSRSGSATARALALGITF